MRASHIIAPVEIPEDVEITQCKPSRRGKRSRDLNMTGGLSARHKPHKHRVSWDAAEAFAPGASIAARTGGEGEA